MLNLVLQMYVFSSLLYSKNKTYLGLGRIYNKKQFQVNQPLKFCAYHICRLNRD